MNILLILLLLAGLGVVIWLARSKRGTPGLTGGLVVVLLVIAGFSLSRSCAPEPEYMAEKKIEVFGALGWKVATLINESHAPDAKVLLLRPQAPTTRSSFVPPYVPMEAGILDAIDDRDRVVTYDVELPEGLMEGIPVDQVAAALDARPEAGVIVSLIGPPDKLEAMGKINPDKIPFYAVCRLESPILQKLANHGILEAALVPRRVANWNEEPPENTHEAIFEAYCIVYRKKP